MSEPTRRQLKFGRRPAKNAPALRLAPLLTGVVPEHPVAADYLSLGGWDMLGNDRYGDCVAVTWANVRRLLTRQAGAEKYPDLEHVIAFYKTQNPNFPADDNGMVIQTALEDLVHNGGPDGVKAIAFAKVDHTNPDEVKAAIAVFGYVWVGITVQAANMDQFDQGQPWDYVPSSSDEGGHSIVVGGYDSDGTGGDERFITWARETSFTDAYWLRKVDEAWVVVFPEHFTMTPFLDGVDLDRLAADYQTLTGRALPLPTPPQPAPTPAPTPVPTPVPTPTPDPGAAPFPGADPAVASHVAHSAALAKLTPAAWLNRHFRTYFGIRSAGEALGGQEQGEEDQEVFRDSVTGRFVTDDYAKDHPDTTQADHV